MGEDLKSRKMLECVRPNGETLLIPKVDPLELAKGRNFTSRRGKPQVLREVNGELTFVDYDEEEKRASTMIITDEIPAMRCYACRSWHTSKSAFRNCYKRHGFIEVGNESLAIKPDKSEEESYEKQLEDDVAWAFNALKNDEAPIDELTRARCKIMDEQIKNSGDNRMRSHDGTLLEGEE